MTLRKPHGQAAKGSIAPRVEVPPVDELGAGVQAASVADAGDERYPNGRLRPGSRKTQSAGGKARKAKLAMTKRVLGAMAAHPEFKPYLDEAPAFARRLRQHFRANVAGGESNAAIESVILTASLQHVASLFVYAQAAETGDHALFAQASRLANDSRQNVLAAHHLAELHAKSRPQAIPPLWVDVPAEAPAVGDDEEGGR